MPEDAKEKQGGLLLDRQSGWLAGGNTNAAVVPGEPGASLMITAVQYDNDDLQMPPDGPLDATSIQLLEEWIRRGAPGPTKEMGETAFSRLGDQDFLFGQAASHWSFQPVAQVAAPQATDPAWNQNPIDRFVFTALTKEKLTPSPVADSRSLIRRL